VSDGAHIVLRRPLPSDADAIGSYDPADTADTAWLSPPTEVLEDPEALVHDYLAGWRGQPHRLGVTLVIADARTDRLVGVVHLHAAGGDLSVDHGVAPDHRRQGIAAWSSARSRSTGPRSRYRGSSGCRRTPRALGLW
jgi:RimJ/RimL family protein N-acetyltransferase